MSSSDDLDEDELLQMALKEQSQRDVTYQKPPSANSRKPVTNLVQQPRKQKRAAAPPSKGGAKASRKPSMDEDDESEVELLSISSGDEDEGTDRGRGGGGDGGGGRGRGGSGKERGRARKEDDRAWDGVEPDCWKRVNEAELARKVRDMRESRTAPSVTQNLDRKVSGADKKVVLTSLQSFPRGMECIDPLKLGIIDNKTLRLITESSESLSKAEKVDNALREKLVYTSDHFDPKLFISRIHQETSAADLESGALALKSDLKGRNLQRKQLVKDNFDCFVSCKTTIDDIESKLKRIEDDPDGSGTTHLFNCMKSVTSRANRAFEPLFERQAQAEKIRSVQGMLQRFRTLFNLPSIIRSSISKGEYDLAVREYKKAKSIALPSHVNLLKRVLEEVEKVMQEFKGTLYRSMEDPKIDFTSLENTVRLLLELEPESDPVWHYLNVQNHRIHGMLEKCTFDHEARMEILRNQVHERALSDAKWRQIQQNGVQLSDDTSSMEDNQVQVDQPLEESARREKDALRGRYIKILTAVIVYHLPTFWKTALSVFTGKFAKSSQVNDTSASKAEEKAEEARYSSHSLEEIAGMIRNTISVYEAKVQSTFHDFDESYILHPYMNDTIKEVSKACQAFEAKESAPHSAVMALRKVKVEITKIYIQRLCSWMRASTEEISKEETWIPVSILERNRSPYSISYLPLAFRSIIVSGMEQINMMILSLKGEAARSEDMFAHIEEILISVRLAFLNCFLDFAAHLEQIGADLSQRTTKRESWQNGYSNDHQEEQSINAPESVVDPHRQLLMILSNIGYCKDELASELYNKYKYTWLQSRRNDEDISDLQDLMMSFSGLGEKVLEHYTFAKANLIRTAATNYLLDSGIQWGAAPPVKGIRDAAVELLHTLVAVHAEVFAGAKPLLDKILGTLVEGLIDTFLSLLEENRSDDLSSIDANGFCQLMLELEYFETILKPYLTVDATESLKSLQGAVLEKAIESISETVENNPGGHQRKPTRGSEDAISDDKQSSVSPDDLLALAQQCTSGMLQLELEKTRLNSACFIETIPLDPVPPVAKAAYSRTSTDSPSRNYRESQPMGSPVQARPRRR
ncbi:Exocyst complex component EXOC2/Sec5 N-terminal domain [Arabidopsis suecica]|uniref:Exocyst complex component SEC5 n=1 Tax=Arabidopsis suecica TaxID=45249 RepID=A0A8T2H728_ARASU|nr:Exocyst complex component EXOC2/Sec5 N-terminal domain [Arabidopsis suecica]